MSNVRRDQVILTDDFRRLLIVCQAKGGQHLRRESDGLHLKDSLSQSNDSVVQNLDRYN